MINRRCRRVCGCVSDVNSSGTIDKKDFEIAIEVSDNAPISPNNRLQ